MTKENLPKNELQIYMLNNFPRLAEKLNIIGRQEQGFVTGSNPFNDFVGNPFTK